MAFLPLSPLLSRARRRRQRSTPPPSCCLPSGLYTTLQSDGTPLCRLITALPPPPPPPTLSSTDDVTRAIHASVDAGLCTFDVPPPAPHTPEGTFAREYARVVGRAASRRAQFCTTVTIHPAMLPAVSRRVVEGYVDGALRSLAQERIHLLQLEWRDWTDARYVDFLGYLGDMRARGKVRSVGVANFATQQLREVQRQGVGVASNRVAFSLMDRRALVEMADWCVANGVALLASSVLGGGLFSDKFLGMPEPTRKVCEVGGVQRVAAFMRMWGGWSLFQEMLYAQKLVADKYGVSVENVAVKWALEQEALSAVVVGARLGLEGEDHVLSNLRAFEFSLDEEDRDMLDAVAMKGNDMYRLLGDSGNEYQPTR